jgi:hypothetical protein
MSELVDPSEIERIVGIARHATRHYANAVSAEQTLYILHSHKCKDSGIDLRECPFSIALDRGIEMDVWGDFEDQPMRVTINRSGRLIHSGPGMRVTT